MAFPASLELTWKHATTSVELVTVVEVMERLLLMRPRVPLSFVAWSETPATKTLLAIAVEAAKIQH